VKPTIGITCDFAAGERPPFAGEEPTLYLRARYVRAVEFHGGIPLLLPIVSRLPLIRALLERIDGLLLTGSGPDINPELYGEQPRFPFPIMSPERSQFELDLARRALRQRCPILGICGGMQLLNVVSGGTLIQDVAHEVPGALEHRQKGGELSHSVRVVRESLLYRILKRTTFKTNSFHHQAIRKVGSGFRISARSTDGVIEGIERSSGPFVLGVQWHPEYLLSQRESRTIFLAFLKAARGRGRASGD